MKGIYAGSYDPPTNGHLWMIEQGARLFTTFYVAVGQNSQKEYCFSLDERTEMLEELCSRFDNVKVVHFENKFLVKYAESIGADIFSAAYATKRITPTSAACATSTAT